MRISNGTSLRERRLGVTAAAEGAVAAEEEDALAVLVDGVGNRLERLGRKRRGGHVADYVDFPILLERLLERPVLAAGDDESKVDVLRRLERAAEEADALAERVDVEDAQSALLDVDVGGGGVVDGDDLVGERLSLDLDAQRARLVGLEREGHLLERLLERRADFAGVGRLCRRP